MQKAIFFLFLTSLIWSCQSQGPAPSSTDPFAQILACFEPDSNIHNWGSQAHELALEKPDIYAIDAGKALHSRFKKIPSAFRELFDLSHPNEHALEGPLGGIHTDFEFYGFRKKEYNNFWLLSFLAHKPQIKEGQRHVFPFWLATFDKEGKPLDHQIWWWIEDDMYQTWTTGSIENGIFQCLNPHQENSLLFQFTLTNQGTFSPYENLEKKAPLDLTNLREWDALEPALQSPKEVIKLNLSSSRFIESDYGSLPESICRLSNIRWLSLHRNNLQTLPDGFDCLKALEVLQLSENPNLDWAKACSLLNQLPQLRELDLSGNRFEEFPEGLYLLSGLEKLYLFDNPLNPKALRDLQAGMPETAIFWE